MLYHVHDLTLVCFYYFTKTLILTDNIWGWLCKYYWTWMSVSRVEPAVIMDWFCSSSLVWPTVWRCLLEQWQVQHGELPPQNDDKLGHSVQRVVPSPDDQTGTPRAHLKPAMAFTGMRSWSYSLALHIFHRGQETLLRDLFGLGVTLMDVHHHYTESDWICFVVYRIVITDLQQTLSKCSKEKHCCSGRQGQILTILIEFISHSFI